MGGSVDAATLVKIGTATVLGAAATTLTLSGLDLSAYAGFYIEFALDNATGSSSNISLYYNGDTTATNYNRTGITVITSATVTNGNDGVFGNMPINETSTGQIWIKNDRDGRPRANNLENRGASSAGTARINWHSWTSASNVTSITFSASIASSLAVGSTFTVYGIRA